MAAPTTAVDICNLAVSRLKVQDSPISAIDPPNTPEEKTCSIWYDQTRQAVLRAHPWNFAIKRISLSADATAPVFGFSNRSSELPSDYLRFLTLGENEEIRHDYEIENNRILTNTDAPYLLKYIFDQTDILKWDALAKRALVAELSSNMGYAFTGNRALGQDLEKEYQEILAEARSIDGQERPAKRITDSLWLRARQFGRRFDVTRLG